MTFAKASIHVAAGFEPGLVGRELKRLTRLAELQESQAPIIISVRVLRIFVDPVIDDLKVTLPVPAKNLVQRKHSSAVVGSSAFSFVADAIMRL
jgi:hypothetical protein